MKSFVAIAISFLTINAAAQPHLAVERLAVGLDRPDGIVSAGDSRLFVVGARGKIFVYDGTSVLAQPFLDVSSRISPPLMNEPERGLLGLAFHPDFSRNGFFFIDYVNNDGNITVARYSVSMDPNRAAQATGVEVLTIRHPQFSDHFGGQLQFGPDGYLYISVGDGGGSGDPLNRAQDASLLLGKILRIDVDDLPYLVPSSNPFVGHAGERPEIWAYGLRNPWRFSFDRATGDLWIGDVGENLWEEVDFQPAGGQGGQNYGWRAMEGSHCFNPFMNCQNPAFTMPILEYSHSDGSCSITGGYVYRGSQFPWMTGLYFYGDFCTGVIYGLSRQPDGTWSSQKLLDTDLLISTFGEDQNGELYVADLRGSLYRIIDTSPPPIPRHRAIRK